MQLHAFLKHGQHETKRTEMPETNNKEVHTFVKDVQPEKKALEPVPEPLLNHDTVIFIANESDDSLGHRGRNAPQQARRKVGVSLAKDALRATEAKPSTDTVLDKGSTESLASRGLELARQSLHASSQGDSKSGAEETWSIDMDAGSVAREPDPEQPSFVSAEEPRSCLKPNVEVSSCCSGSSDEFERQIEDIANDLRDLREAVCHTSQNWFGDPAGFESSVQSLTQESEVSSPTVSARMEAAVSAPWDRGTVPSPRRRVSASSAVSSLAGMRSMPRSRGSLRSSLKEIRKASLAPYLSKALPVDEMLDEPRDASLRESIWDVTLFMFYPPLGWRVNTLMLLLFLCSLAFQLLCLIVVRRERDISLDRVASLNGDYALWRSAADAHLVAAVCSGNHSLTGSFGQASTYDTFSQYSETLLAEGPAFSAGRVTSWLVCVAWILAVVENVGCVLDKMRGSWCLLQTEKLAMLIEASQTEPLTLALHHIPTSRAAWFSSVTVLQGVLLVLLMVAGLEWLSVTADIVDVLLKGVVLAYILDFDRLIYKVCIPAPVGTLVRLLVPFPTQWQARFPSRFLTLMAVALPCVAYFASLLEGHFTESSEVRKTLCETDDK